MKGYARPCGWYRKCQGASDEPCGQPDDGQLSQKAAKWTEDMGAHLADFGQAEELLGKNNPARNQ